jgi:hypothetical protein
VLSKEAIDGINKNAVAPLIEVPKWTSN